MKKLALLAGCLLLFSCSSDGGNAGPGHGGQGGGQAGSTGAAGTTGGAGTTGSAGTNGSAGTSGSAGTTGSAGTSGGAGTTGGGGQTGGSTGSAGRGGTTGGAGTTGNAGTNGGAGNGAKGGSSGQGGKAGQGGGGGQAGKGQGGTGGIQNCPEWETLYAKALQTARMCNAALSVVQCATVVSSKLACGCPMYVNDSTELDKIRAEWLQSSCALNVICPAIACPLPAKAACVLMNSGDFCVSAVTPTPL